MTEADQRVSRLCRSCGLCCNGVLFETVRLQPGDIPKTLVSIGLKLKRKHGKPCMLQPCPVWGANGCSVYENRPVRCRQFECAQVVRFREGSLSEISVDKKIQAVKKQAEEIRLLLVECGSKNVHRPLLKRCEMVLSDYDALGIEDSILVAKLRSLLIKLEAALDSEFRIEDAKVTE